jgi:membrane dipeptidase
MKHAILLTRCTVWWRDSLPNWAWPKTACEIEERVAEGKHAIILGLENGYPIGNTIAFADTFYNLGVRYITLCHTRNNDICDSSTDEKGTEHGGLSVLGESLVERMNQLGIMVDVSHISDEAFYDVLRLSKDPVIASHSSARALCDHPRNLSDEMLRAIAAKGGVVQVCILSAYLETPEAFPARDSARAAVIAKHGDYYSLDAAGRENFLADWYQVDRDFPPKLANVKVIADHIDHMVKTAGINHVGIGTDFDGGGGVYGCYDVSELPNITAELVARGYTYREIEKIWGGNLLRVMREVEKE